MNLLCFEAKKFFIKPSVIACIAIFFILNICKVFEVKYHFGESERIGYDVLYEQIAGVITTQKEEFLNSEMIRLQEILSQGNEYNIEETYSGYAFADIWMIRQEFLEPFEYALTYPEQIVHIREKAQNNIAFFSEHNNNFQIARNKQILSLYGENRTIYYFSNTEGINWLLNYKFSSLLIILLIILCISPIMNTEKSTGTDALIKSSGKMKQTLICKISLMFIYITMLTLLFGIADYFIFRWVFGMDYLQNALYGIESYALTPFDITQNSAIVMAVALRLVAFYMVGTVVFLISVLVKNIGLSIAVSFAFLGTLILLSEYLPSFANPLNLVAGSNYMTELNVVNLFGIPVQSFIVSLGLTILLALGATIAVVLIIIPRKEKRNAKI